ncbi:radical SAM/SPASM domain-containing protein [Porphyromonas levii]|nr:radical SAM protein [Porphyromonas levii]
MQYKISTYCTLFCTPEGKTYAYLATDNSLLEISRDCYRLLMNFHKKKLFSKEDLRKSNIPVEFIERGVITTIEDEDIYIRAKKLEMRMSSMSKEKLILVIAPTTECNFACPYCFEENKENVFMSDETIDALVHFVKEFKDSKYLHLTWYGGEPLLAIKTIEKILVGFKDNAPEKEIIFNFLVTNGYLVNQKVINVFQEFPLDRIQVTIDGEKERHNATRCLKSNGKGTFDKIVENIGLLLHSLEKTNIHVRVNIDKNNVNDYILIRDLLESKYSNYRERLNVYPGIIRIEDKKNKCMGCESLLHDDIRNLFFNIKERVNFYPVLQGKDCFATHLNSFMIGPKGELYKCWNELGDKKKIIGDIFSGITNVDLMTRYIVSANCFDDPMCKDCKHLPICSGGCAYYRIKNIYEDSNYNICSLYKGVGVLEKCLMNHLAKISNNKVL